MTRRRLLVFGLLAGVTVVVLLALWLLSLRTAITRENYDKIPKGMPRDEVEAILGAPNQITDEPRLYTWFKVVRGLPPAWAVGDWQHRAPDVRYAHTATWYSPETWIEIDFDDNDRVCGTQYSFAFAPKK